MPDISSSQPLAHRTVVVACSAKKMDALVGGIQALGGRALSFPVIEVREIEDNKPLDAAIASLREYAWIIFTSAYGARFFLNRLNLAGINLASDSIPKICAIGPATARELQQAGYKVELIPEKFVAEGLVEALEKYYGGLKAIAGSRVLLPRAREAREVLPEALAAAGIFVDAIPCYETVCAGPVPEMLQFLRSSKPDMLVFTSSSAIRSFVKILGKEDGVRLLLESAVAVLGPITGGTAESFGKRAEVMPRENTTASLLEAIREYYTKCR